MNRKRRDGFDYYIDRYQNDMDNNWYDYEPYYDDTNEHFRRKNRYISDGNRGHRRPNDYYDNYRTTTQAFNQPHPPIHGGTMEFTAVPGHNLDVNSRVLGDQTMMMGRTYDMNVNNAVRQNNYLTKGIARQQIKNNNMLATRTHQLQQRVDDLGEAMSIMSNKLDNAMDFISNEVKQTNDLINKTRDAYLEHTATLSFKNDYADERSKEDLVAEIKKVIEEQIKSEFDDKLKKYDEFVKKQEEQVQESIIKNEFEQKLNQIKQEYEDKISEIQNSLKNNEERFSLEEEKELIAKDFEKKLEEEINKIQAKNAEEISKIQEKNEEKIKQIKELSENKIKSLEENVDEIKSKEKENNHAKQRHANSYDPYIERELVDEVINPVKVTPNVEKTVVIKDQTNAQLPSVLEEERKRRRKRNIIIWSVVGVVVLLAIAAIVTLFVLNQYFIIF